MTTTLTPTTTSLRGGAPPPPTRQPSSPAPSVATGSGAPNPTLPDGTAQPRAGAAESGKLALGGVVGLVVIVLAALFYSNSARVTMTDKTKALEDLTFVINQGNELKDLAAAVERGDADRSEVATGAQQADSEFKSHVDELRGLRISDSVRADLEPLSSAWSDTVEALGTLAASDANERELSAEAFTSAWDGLHERVETLKEDIVADADGASSGARTTMILSVVLVLLAAGGGIVAQLMTNRAGARARAAAREENLKAQSALAEAGRLSSMVENAPINMMLCDRELTLIYMNPASRDTLRKIERNLPVRVDEMIGQSIDIFHKHPEHQRRLLADPRNLPHRARIQVGDDTMDLNVTAVMVDGEYVGAMASWELITERLAQERAVEEANRREREAAEQLRTKVDQMLSAVRAAAAGDLTVEVPVQGEDPIGQMGEGLASFLADLRTSVGEIAQAADSVAAAAEELTATSNEMGANAEETSAQANVVSAAAEQVSANVNTVASGAEQMAASIKEIAANASTANSVATEAVATATRTNDTVSKLGESSAEIGQIIKVITSIAQQTNLLALNATIEAARAGEAGKGFAVVANEVKELAKETARATEDISQKIDAIQSDTTDAVEAIAAIGGIIDKISGIQNTIASAVEEQAATTAEIGRNVNEAARGSNEIAQNISAVAEAAASTSSGVTETQASAGELARTSTTLKSLVERFRY